MSAAPAVGGRFGGVRAGGSILREPGAGIWASPAESLLSASLPKSTPWRSPLPGKPSPQEWLYPRRAWTPSSGHDIPTKIIFLGF